MSDEYWSESNFEAEPGRPLPAVPNEFSEVELYRVPDRLSAGWIEKQLPKSVWRENRSALNPHMILSMTEDARKGLSKRAIMARAGLSVNTWAKWEKRATEGDLVFALWYKCMIHSISSVESKLIGNVMDAADEDWKAAKWLLERLNKEEYADTQAGLTVNIDKSDNKTTINTITDDSAQAVARLLQELGVANSSTIDAEVVEDGEEDD